MELDNLCGGKERILDELDNGFGWSRFQKSLIAEKHRVPRSPILICNFYKAKKHLQVFQQD